MIGARKRTRITKAQIIPCNLKETMMNQHSWRNPALVLMLLTACVLGCKSGRTSTTSNTNQSTTTNTDQSSQTSSTTAAAPDVAGKYNVVGTNPNNTGYRGTLEVIEHGQVYQFRWNAGVQYDGVGVQNGDVVAAAFANGPNGKGCGVVDYTITNDGTLDGKWGYWGTNESGTEKATRTSGSGLIGIYDATGTNPNGGKYRATILVAPSGSGYQFTWTNNTNGYGIKRGDNVAVGIGGRRCGFVMYEVKPDGTLDGVWGGYGSDKTGTEKATKQ